MFQNPSIVIWLLVFYLICISSLSSAAQNGIKERVKFSKRKVDLDDVFLFHSNQLKQRILSESHYKKFYDSYMNKKFRSKLIEPLKNLHLVQRNSR